MSDYFWYVNFTPNYPVLTCTQYSCHTLYIYVWFIYSSTGTTTQNQIPINAYVRTYILDLSTIVLKVYKFT